MYPVLPEHITNIISLESEGTEVTITLPGKDTVSIKVTQSAEAIAEAIVKAKEVDGI